MGKKDKGRPRTNQRKTTLGVRLDLASWFDFVSDTHLGGISGYVNDMARRDRDRILAEGGETAERYKAYLFATGRDQELMELEGVTPPTRELYEVHAHPSITPRVE